MHAQVQPRSSAAPAHSALAAHAPDGPPLAEAPHAWPGAQPPWRRSLAVVEKDVPFTRRIVRVGDLVQRAGQRFGFLHIAHSGVFKAVNLAADGREQIVDLHFKGHWMGFDGLATRTCACSVVAVETGEVWSVAYGTLLEAAVFAPALTHALHGALGGQMTRDREWRLSQASLGGDARVAQFICRWAAAIAERGLRADLFTLPLSRSEIGSYLGLTLETVSRALARLARRGLIGFAHPCRRTLSVPSLARLADAVNAAPGLSVGAVSA
jgi:CRP/FNR family transcriptional regulator